MDYWTEKAARPAQLAENVLIPRKALSCFTTIQSQHSRAYNCSVQQVFVTYKENCL